MNKIILDVDPGIDDTFLILLASNSEELDIQGICTVAGNCSLENATNNTFKALDLANKNNIPVYKGMNKALQENGSETEKKYEQNGLGGITYKPTNRNPEEKNAIDYLIETVKNNPNEITIVAVGPLTNIATAINKDPLFAKNVKQLIIMGGSSKDGNITPYAEFNFYKDPDAAKIVFETEFKEIVMFGIDVTSRLFFDKKQEEILQNINTDKAQFLFQIARKGAEFYKSVDEEGLILHDPLTVAYLIDPSIVEFKPANINIETKGEKIGKSNVQFTQYSNIKIGINADRDKYYKLLFKRILDVDID